MTLSTARVRTNYLDGRVRVSTDLSTKHSSTEPSFKRQVVWVMSAGGNGGRFPHTEGAAGHLGA